MFQPVTKFLVPPTSFENILDPPLQVMGHQKTKKQAFPKNKKNSETSLPDF